MPPDGKKTWIVSSGDPAGSSPELIPHLLQNLKNNEKIVITGPEAVKEKICPRLETTSSPVEQAQSSWFIAGDISPGKISAGRPDKETGTAAIEALKAALEFVKTGNTGGLLTLPLAKNAVRAAGYPKFTGHTEYLEKFAGKKGVMTFFGKKFNCALLTRHLPLRRVPEQITTKLVIDKVKICSDYFKKSGNDSPRFALLGLNPHAGEEGSLGDEEMNVLKPALEKLKEDKINITGPHPADSFLPVQGQNTDMIISCYHDQGLTPFKQAHFFSGVHATLGLGFYRASPVHGTASSLAGSNKINPQSALNCLRWLRRHSR